MKNNKNNKLTGQRYILSLCIYGFVALCLIFISGCGQQQTTSGDAIAAETSEVSRTMQAAEEVLIKMHFDIAKSDYDKGYIRTRPLAGAQFFEFWRSDNVDLESQLLANMHSIRRIVELNISDANGTLDTDCKVHVQRLSIPERGTSGGSTASQTYAMNSVSFQRLHLNPIEEATMTWLDLDRDTKLEKEILKRISSTIDKKFKNTQSKTQPAGENS